MLGCIKVIFTFGEHTRKGVHVSGKGPKPWGQVMKSPTAQIWRFLFQMAKVSVGSHAEKTKRGGGLVRCL
jgi:hypothetical protein